MLVEHFNVGLGKAKVSHWAVCQEQHEDGGLHYHALLKLTGGKKWLKVKESINNDHGIMLNFSDNHNYHIAAYRYICKTGNQVYHSDGHPDLSDVGSPQTKRSTAAYRHSRKRVQQSKDVGGCIEASFTILETINHYLECESQIFGCFLDVRKAFDTVWIDGLFYKLFTELGINGRFWLVLKDLYTDVNAKVLFSGHLSRSFSISQGTGQGRILAPFMYKVYINSLLNEVSEHNFAICISSMKLSAPSFADDISLLVLYPTFLQHLMNIAYEYSLKWRYEFNNIKSGMVTYGESKPSHFANMQERSWTLCVENVDELYEYKNLGVYKNYCGSFVANIEEHIEKTRKKAGMIFSANIDRCKTNPLIYVKYWKQHVPKFASSILIERLACYLDLLFTRDRSNNITTKLYDKPDAFGFHMLTFPSCQTIFHQHQPMVSMHFSSFAMPVVAQVILTF